MIPKAVHQIYWDFTKRANEMQPKWKSYTNTLQLKHSNCTYVDWNEEMVHNLVERLVSTEEFEIFKNIAPIVQVDFARLAIMYQIGGVYVDRDIECNNSLEPLLENKYTSLLFFVEGYLEKEQMYYIGNAAMACEKHHPLMDEIFIAAREKLLTYRGKTEWNDYDILYSFGPHFVSHFIKHAYGDIKHLPIDVVQKYVENKVKDGQADDGIEDFLNYRYENNLFFLPPEAMLGCDADAKGSYFGSHKTHGSWKSKFK